MDIILKDITQMLSDYSIHLRFIQNSSQLFINGKNPIRKIDFTHTFLFF